MVETMIRYKFEETNGASSKFVQKYRNAYSLIAANNIAEAGPLLQELEQGALNYFTTRKRGFGG
jgi:hypothetical protein